MLHEIKVEKYDNIGTEWLTCQKSNWTRWWVLRECRDQLMKPISNMTNASLKEGGIKQKMEI